MDHLQHRNSSTHWELDFVRLVQDWELESITVFLDLLYFCTVKGYGTDIWNFLGKTDFAESRYYRAHSSMYSGGFPLEGYLGTQSPSTGWWIGSLID